MNTSASCLGWTRGMPDSGCGRPHHCCASCGEAIAPMKESTTASRHPRPHPNRRNLVARPSGSPPRDPNSHEFAVQNGFNVQVTPLWHGRRGNRNADGPLQ